MGCEANLEGVSLMQHEEHTHPRAPCAVRCCHRQYGRRGVHWWPRTFVEAEKKSLPGDLGGIAAKSMGNGRVETCGIVGACK